MKTLFVPEKWNLFLHRSHLHRLKGNVQLKSYRLSLTRIMNRLPTRYHPHEFSVCNVVKVVQNFFFPGFSHRRNVYEYRSTIMSADSQNVYLNTVMNKVLKQNQRKFTINNGVTYIIIKPIQYLSNITSSCNSVIGHTFTLTPHFYSYTQVLFKLGVDCIAKQYIAINFI